MLAAISVVNGPRKGGVIMLTSAGIFLDEGVVQVISSFSVDVHGSVFP